MQGGGGGRGGGGEHGEEGNTYSASRGEEGGGAVLGRREEKTEAEVFRSFSSSRDRCPRKCCSLYQPLLSDRAERLQCFLSLKHSPETKCSEKQET